MRKVLKLCLGLLVLSSIVNTSLAGIEKQIIEAKDILKRGVDLFDPDLLLKARVLFLDILSDVEENSTYLLFYYVALTDYRLVTYNMSIDDKEEAQRYNEEASKYLERAMKMNPDFSESYALYATILGVEIGLNPMKGISLGPKVSEYLAKALEKGPNNPRVNFLRGTNALYTPPNFGGGVDKAIFFFKKSLECYENEQIKNLIQSSWGKEEVYNSLGIVYYKYKKDEEKAVESFKKALEVNPNFAYARKNLAAIEEKRKN